MSSSKKKRGGALMSIALLAATGIGAPVTSQAAYVADPVGVSAPALPEGIEKITSVEGITEYRLRNGLKVLLFPDQSKPTITVNITYLVGSRHENYGETGMAHLLEHLMFKGSPKHTNIPDELSSHGTRPNGTTWYDRTNYYESFQASDANLEWALDLEADRMVNSFIAKKDLDSEMTVVRNEFEAGENSPQGVLFERTLSTAYLWHNYGKSTIGARADLENVPIDRLQAFYRTYYQPDNAILLVAGKFDEEKTLKLIDKYFAGIAKPNRQLPKTYTLDPTQDGERLVTLRRVGDVQAVCAAYHIPAGAHPDYPAVEIMTRVLGDFTVGRLRKSLVETKKATSASGFAFQLREPGISVFQAEVRQDNSLEEARDIMLKTVEELATKPATQEEVDRARNNLLKNLELTLNSSEDVGLSISEWAAMGDWRLIFLHRDRLKKVTVDDVNRAAKTYLKTSNRTVGMFIPTKTPDRAEIPSTPDVAELLKDYKGNTAVATGEAFDASPANIEARTTRNNTSGGLKLALLPKKTRGNTVNMTMTIRFGDEKSLFNRATAAQLAGQMLMRGTAKHTREQIRTELDRLKARAFVSGGATSAFVFIETTRENLPEVIKLMAECLKEPTFPQKEFDELIDQQLASIEQQRSEPESVGGTEFERHFNPYPKGDVRYVSSPDEDIAEVKAIKLDDLKKFYSDFYGASAGEVAIVGDFDDKEVGKLINDLFGNWQSKAKYERIASPYQDLKSINKALETPDKANAFFLAGQPLNLRDDDPEYPALIMGNYILGGGFLNSRLGTRIRQKDGLSYGVGSQLFADSFDKRGQFVTFAIYAPENAEKVEKAFKEEVERMLKDGFTAEELAAAKSGYLQSRQVSRAQDRELAGRLASYLRTNRTLIYDAEFDNKIQALTVEQVNAAMRKYIDVNKITIVKAGDFAKAKATAK